MNAFDLIVTVALGSTLATILLDNSIPIVNGVSALGLLILLQYAWRGLEQQIGLPEKEDHDEDRSVV